MIIIYFVKKTSCKMMKMVREMYVQVSVKVRELSFRFGVRTLTQYIVCIIKVGLVITDNVDKMYCRAGYAVPG